MMIFQPHNLLLAASISIYMAHHSFTLARFVAQETSAGSSGSRLTGAQQPQVPMLVLPESTDDDSGSSPGNNASTSQPAQNAPTPGFVLPASKGGAGSADGEKSNSSGPQQSTQGPGFVLPESTGNTGWAGKTNASASQPKQNTSRGGFALPASKGDAGAPNAGDSSDRSVQQTTPPSNFVLPKSNGDAVSPVGTHASVSQPIQNISTGVFALPASANEASSPTVNNTAQVGNNTSPVSQHTATQSTELSPSALDHAGYQSHGNSTEICDQESPTPDVWQKLKIGDFMRNYPNGAKLTIKEFAEQNNAPNFVCGIGETCDAGQLCSPILGPVWHVLYAVQQWNNIQESFNKAITFAASMVNSVGASLAIDLFEPDMKKVNRLFKSANILTILVAVSAVICMAVLMFIPGAQFINVGIASGVSAMIAGAQGGTSYAALRAYNNMKSDAFSRWSGYTESIAKWQEDMQTDLFNSTSKVLSSAISDPNGMLGLLGNGTYFTSTLEKTTNEIQESLTKVLTARLINSILIDKKAFVTVGSNGCDQGGPDGAFKIQDGWLSWCKDGRMMNIVQAKGDDVNNKIYNSGAIVSKYGITVEYMVTQSENCQIKYGGWSHNPYTNTTIPTDANADCLFNLPVCYVGDWKHVRKHKRKHGTVEACRKRAGLPI